MAAKSFRYVLRHLPGYLGGDAVDLQCVDGFYFQLPAFLPDIVCRNAPLEEAAGVFGKGEGCLELTGRYALRHGYRLLPRDEDVFYPFDIFHRVSGHHLFLSRCHYKGHAFPPHAATGRSSGAGVEKHPQGHWETGSGREFAIGRVLDERYRKRY
jgi:hypothetical protein